MTEVYARRNAHNRQRGTDNALASANRCSVCTRQVHPGHQQLHPGSISTCECTFHAECVINAIQCGRSECSCGAPFLVDDTISVVVPAELDNTHMQAEPRAELVAADLASYGNECAICTYPLFTSDEATDLPIGHPTVCEHQFHLHCLLEDAFSPVRSRARGLGWDQRQSKCPICRRDYVQIEAIPANSAPNVLIHYESIERNGRRSNSSAWTGRQYPNQEQDNRNNAGQDQPRGWGNFWWAVAVGVGGIIVLLFAAR